MRRRNLFISSFLFVFSAFVLFSPWRVSAAVTISSFSARWQGNSVIVNWRTGSELNNAGFNILRSTSADGAFTKVNYTPAQFGSIAGASYAFTDSGVTPGTTYYYRLQSIDTAGKVDTFHQPAIAQAPAAPTATALPPTATATRTPTRTATNVPGAPTSTPAPPTATATPPPPQFTPTRTPTYPPGITPPTPVPPTPTVRVAYAVQPTATRAAIPASAAPSVAPPSPTRAAMPANAAPSVAPPEPTRVALAVKEVEPDASEEAAEAIPVAPDDGALRARQLIIGAGIFLLGVVGAGGLLLGILAIYLAFRARREI